MSDSASDSDHAFFDAGSIATSAGTSVDGERSSPPSAGPVEPMDPLGRLMAAAAGGGAAAGQPDPHEPAPPGHTERPADFEAAMRDLELEYDAADRLSSAALAEPVLEDALHARLHGSSERGASQGSPPRQGSGQSGGGVDLADPLEFDGPPLHVAPPPQQQPASPRHNKDAMPLIDAPSERGAEVVAADERLSRFEQHEPLLAEAAPGTPDSERASAALSAATSAPQASEQSLLASGALFGGLETEEANALGSPGAPPHNPALSRGASGVDELAASLPRVRTHDAQDATASSASAAEVGAALAAGLSLAASMDLPVSMPAQLHADAVARRSPRPASHRAGAHPADVAAGTPKPTVPRTASAGSSLSAEPSWRSPRRGATPAAADGAAAHGGDCAAASMVPAAQQAGGDERSKRRLFDAEDAAPDFERMLREKERHYFIISNTGRPIYSRHGHTHEAASIAATIFGLVSMAHSAVGETPQLLQAGAFALCVRVRPVAGTAPAVAASLANVGAFAAVACRRGTPHRVLRLHAELLHLQFLAWTTSKYEGALADNPTLDPADTLAGTAASFAALLERLPTALEPAAQAAEVLPMPPLLRGAAAASLAQAVADSGCLFGVIACGYQVAALAHSKAAPPHHRPHAYDLLLLLTFVASNPSHRTDLAGQQAWAPLCLPRSAPHAFHFAYVHYPSRDSPLFVALVARGQQMFFDVHAAREPLMESLESTGVLEHVARTAQSDAPLRPAPKDVPLAGHFSHLQGCLYWFAVAKVASGTFVRSAFDELLAGNETAQREVLHDVLRLHSSMWAAAGVSSVREAMPLQYRVCARWALLGSIQHGAHEAFIVIDPLVPKSDAMALLSAVVAHTLEDATLWQHDDAPQPSGLFASLQG